jgi:hypothetical protein
MAKYRRRAAGGTGCQVSGMRLGWRGRSLFKEEWMNLLLILTALVLSVSFGILDFLIQTA